MSRKFKIVILTTQHTQSASGIVANDLMHNLKALGHEVLIITNAKLEKKYESTISVKDWRDDLGGRIINRLRRELGCNEKLDPKYYMYGLNEKYTAAKAKKILKKLTFKPDCFIYLFPQNFLTASDLHYLNHKTLAPICWYMMDMAPMTGGCHYAWDCSGYTRQCGECPGIFSKDKKDKTNANWKKKSEFFEKTNITPIAASEWQFMQLEKCSLFKNKPHYKILLAVNNQIFKTTDKLTARKALGLPLNKKLIFFGSVNVNDYRKGFKELITSLKLLKNKLTDMENEEIHLIIAGKFNDELNEKLAYNHSFLGYVNHTQLADVFNAAHLFVCPSIQDSGPMMINQSIMCGTPVVSFEMGVAFDLVHTGETGYRAKLGDTEDLANGIKFVLGLNNIKYEIIRENCRQHGLKLCSPLIQVQQFERYFKA